MRLVAPAIRLSLLPVLYRSLLIIAALGLAQVAWAHRAPGSLTTIEWNETSGCTEIIHRLHSHDAELGVASILGVSKFSIIDTEARAQAALYVESRFHIEQENLELTLELVGAELVGQYLFVYQELPKRLDAKIRVRNDILRDVYAEQINQVNINDGGVVRTLTFAGDEDWLNYEFQHHQEDTPSR